MGNGVGDGRWVGGGKRGRDAVQEQVAEGVFLFLLPSSNS